VIKKVSIQFAKISEVWPTIEKLCEGASADIESSPSIFNLCTSSCTMDIKTLESHAIHDFVFTEMTVVNRVWRHRNFRYNEENVTRVRVFHLNDMGVSFFRTEIVIVPPGLNSARYIEEILSQHVLPMRDRIGRGFLFIAKQCSSSYDTKHSLSQIKHHNPSMSPDFNSIEYL